MFMLPLKCLLMPSLSHQINAIREHADVRRGLMRINSALVNSPRSIKAARRHNNNCNFQTLRKNSSAETCFCISGARIKVCV
jgi:hypothetical protein